MIKTLFTSSVSACFELEGSSPYYSETEYTVKLDGNALFSSDKNVFSLFGLKPGREYTLEANGESLVFKTLNVTFEKWPYKSKFDFTYRFN